MQPNYTAANISPKALHIIGTVVLALALLIIGVVAYRTLTFRVVKTDPEMSRVGNYSPYIKLYFNHDVDPGSVSVDDSDTIIAGTKVSGKTVTFTIDSPLRVGGKYSITLNKVSDRKGHTLANKRFVFTAKDISINKLGRDQQQAIVQQQDKYPYSVHTINFQGFDVVTDNGLTSDQEQVIKQALYDYSMGVNQQLKTVTLNSDSISVPPYDPNSVDLSRGLNFSVLADGTKYNLSVSYSDLTTAHVIITDVAGTVVFDNASSD